MSLFISVVNHNHDKIITSNNTLKNLAKMHYVIIKSNSIASDDLINYCSKNGIYLIQGKSKKGFGANNNEIFNYSKKNLNMVSNDYFLILNPDVEITESGISHLQRLVNQYDSYISTINLYLDKAHTIYDKSIRKYPSLLNPLKSIFGIQRKDYYDKSTILEPMPVDWAAGSFLLFKTECFEDLQGFDEQYFMYFEDVDICTRAKKSGYSVIYFPQVEATHLAMHNNRKIFSKHFLWYCCSALRYSFT